MNDMLFKALNNCVLILLPSGMYSMTRNNLKIRNDLSAAKPAKISKSEINNTPMLGMASSIEKKSIRFQGLWIYDLNLFFPFDVVILTAISMQKNKVNTTSIKSN